MKRETEAGRRNATATSHWKKHEGDSPLASLPGAPPGPHLDFRLPASRAVREHISLVEAILSVVICYDSHRKPTEGGEFMFSGMVEGSFIRSVLVVLHFKGKWRREGGCSRQGDSMGKGLVAEWG